MNNENFVHLHSHSTFSLLDGMGNPEVYAKRAKELGFKYLALTDHGDVSGTLKWQQACEKEGIQSILGTEFYCCQDATNKKEKPRHLTALVQNQTGWKNILQLTTYAHSNFVKRPRVDYDAVLKHANGLVFMSACVNSIMKDDAGEAFFCEDLAKIAPVFIEIMPHNHPLQLEWNQTCLEISDFYNIPLVSTCDTHYVLEEDAESQEVLLAIQRSAKWNDPNRWKFDFKGLHLKTADEMIAGFEKIKIPRSIYIPAMKRTVQIAKMCEGFRIEKKPVHLPLPPGVKGDEFKFLEQLCIKGYYDKVGSLIEPEYEWRMDEELKLIQSKGFVRYFLIVYDLIKFCKHNNIMIGSGRGSAAGSLVTYLLGITTVDPMKYGLLFSRFISEDRIDLPDIDMDFEDTKREQVLNYLCETYGASNIAGISTFLKMKARLIIRDVGRVFDIDLKEVDSFAKSIEGSVQDAIDIEVEGIKKQEELINENKELSKSDKKIELEMVKHNFFHVKYPHVIKHALKLEGQIRGYSRHAAGAVISYEPLSDGRQTYLAERGGHIVIGWDMSDCEYVGLLKLDILGLKTLTVLNYAKDLIKENHGIEIDYYSLPVDDPKVFKALSDGNFTGVFQMGWAVQDVVRKAGVSNIQEWSDVIALGRPGPMESGMADSYIERKHGKEWEKQHPLYEEVTKNTYGVICFQETVMSIFNKVAGLPYTVADKIRKVIGKKRDAKEFEPYRQMFADGCRKQRTMSKDEVDEFWEGLLKHARYSFNMCLSGDTVIIKHGTQRSTLSKLYDDWNSQRPIGQKLRKRGVRIYQLHNDKRIRPGKVKGIFNKGEAHVYEIKTKNGRSIKATSTHRFLTTDGYKTVRRLLAGDRFVVLGPPARENKTDIKKSDAVQIRGYGDSYDGRGFQNGENNIGYVDGRNIFFNKAKKEVFTRSNGKCEKCGKQIYHYCSECGSIVKDERCEFAHIKPLIDFNYDFSQYHHQDNIKYLCNSCHKTFDYKKGERHKIYSIGHSVDTDEIVSIEYAGIEEVFDIEMEGEPNFLANEIVSHNSHSLSYAILGYWTLYTKVYYPAEYMAAFLTYGSDKYQDDMVKNARAIGLQLVPPKIGISDALRWQAKNNKLYLPFAAIDGIGEKTALEIAAGGRTRKLKKKKGFLEDQTETYFTPSVKTTLDNIKAFDLDVPLPKGALHYFSKISMSCDYRESHPNLLKILGRRSQNNELIEQAIRGELEMDLCKTQKKFELNPELIKCKKCELRQECARPVPPSPSDHNLVISGQDPGKFEDRHGVGFIGNAGDVLWEALKKYDLVRDMFHVTNTNKCFPSKSKRSSFEQVELCREWLDEELRIVKPCMVLALGSNAMYFFNQREKGITQYNATIEWNENYSCYVVYCLHPASTLHSPKNKSEFARGIEFFSQKLQLIGGI